MEINEKLDRFSWKPVKVNSAALKKFISKRKPFIVDQYLQNLEELFLLRNPRYRFNKNYKEDFELFKKQHLGRKSFFEKGNWFYFPWSNTILHFLPHNLHQELRTGRNLYLIRKEEQVKYYKAKVGVLGMSVGSHAALTIVMTGGSRHIKIADPDILSGDNLNRIRTGFQNVGINKAVAVARQIYEMNPYARVEIYQEGITEKNISRFLKGLDVLVEEMDNPYLKVKIRFLARKLGIPVIMAADNGDGIIVDVERYDLNKKYPVLHGILGKMTPEDFKNIPPKDIPRIIAKIAGANIADLRMLYSVTEVGKSIYSWPQLGNAATLCGSILAYLARTIILKDKKIKSGRYEVNPKEIFESGYKLVKEVRKRKLAREKFLKMLGLENK